MNSESRGRREIIANSWPMPRSTRCMCAPRTRCISRWRRRRWKPVSMCCARNLWLFRVRKQRGKWCGLPKERSRGELYFFITLRYYPQVQNMRAHARGWRSGRDLRRAGHLFAGLAALRYRLQLAHRDRGERALAGVRRYRHALVRHDRAHHGTADYFFVRRSMQTFHKTRKKPKGSVETFSGKTLQPSDYVEVPIDTEDFGAVLLRLGQKTRGAMTVSQVSAGRKNRLFVEIYGTKGSVTWNQEAPDELWVGQRNTPNQLVVKDPSAVEREGSELCGSCRAGTAGSGYDDTFKQVFRRFYRTVRRGIVARRWSIRRV